MIRLYLLTLFIIAGRVCAIGAPSLSPEAGKLVLKDDWYIQPSSEVSEKGETLSSTSFEPKHWYRATVPSTVMANLVADGVYADPYFGKNLRSISGEVYPIGANYSNIPMPPSSAFRLPWWYRTRFAVPPDFKGKRIQLHFDGINFRANVWLNGRKIASANKIAGSWRLFEVDVTGSLVSGKGNALAVEVFPPTPEDLAITFVDWNPAPPDKGMGLWRPVYLTTSGPVDVRFPQVVTKLDLPSLDTAHLTVTAELHNSTDQPVKGVLRGRIENTIEFSQPVRIEAHQTEIATFSPGSYAQLNLRKPKLWWPAKVGPQNLYGLHLQFETAGVVSDESSIQFGVREVTSELDKGHRLFKINGKNILIRGAGYSFDMLLRESPEREEEELKYVRDLNLNTVRLEGKIADDHFLELTDKYGILVMAGWCCCDHWEKWSDWDGEDRLIASESLKDQIRRLRSHASVFNWMNGSDNPPPPEIEKMYIHVLKQWNWPNPYESSASEKPTPVSGESGVKMSGPYKYVPPSYWLLDTRNGGAFGFNTETSPGAAVPPIEGLREMLPEDHLWPIDSTWDYHAGGGTFKNIGVFANALNSRYGAANNVQDFAMKAQAMTYEGERAMFEAYGRNKYVSTGVIQWMLNNAWPSLIWHLYDYSLRPGGGYFGTKKACELLHVQYSYDDRSVVVVNSFYREYKSLEVSAEVYNLDLTKKFARKINMDVASDGVAKAFVLPQIAGLSTTYFVRLFLHDQAGQEVSSNFYWLSTKPDTLDWDRSTWYYTPVKTYADFKELNTLPQVNLHLSATNNAKGVDGEATTRVTVENPSKSLAFLVHLKMMKRSRDPEEDDPTHESEILPVLWQENYFSLLPGETRQVTGSYEKSDEGTSAPFIAVDGWNIVPKSLEIR